MYVLVNDLLAYCARAPSYLVSAVVVTLPVYCCYVYFIMNMIRSLYLYLKCCWQSEIK